MGPPASMQFLHVIRNFIMIFFSSSFQAHRMEFNMKNHFSVGKVIIGQTQYFSFCMAIEVGADEWTHCVQHFHQKKGSLIK